MTKFRYEGINRDGACVIGAFDLTLAEMCDWVERRHRARWQDLVVKDVDGEEVGSIFRDEDTGRRLWWALT